MKNKFLKLVFLILITASLSTTYAQTATDGLMMAKGYTCLVGQYSKSSWSQYWEGPLKRSNGNIGTFTNENISFLGAIGVSSKFNIFFGVPYVQTNSTQGTLAGQKGIQDLTLWAKYKVVEIQASTGKIMIFGVAGVSAPLTNYVADYQPFSLGMGSKNFGVKAILHYKSNSGVYFTGEVGYTGRSKITVDRDSYLNNGVLYYTNQVPVPDVMDVSGRLGFLNKRIQTEIWVDANNCVGGDDIRLQDMPFPTNKTMATMAGYLAKVFLDKKWAIQGTVSTCLAGRNVGQSTIFSGAVLYTFHHLKDKK